MTTIRTLLLTALLALPAGFAQGFYLGGFLGTPLNPVTDLTEAAEIGGQLGFDFIPYVGLRAAFEGNPFNGSLLGSADLLVRTYIPLTYHNVYAGVGADAFFFSEPSSVEALQDPNLAAYAVVGGEFRFETMRAQGFGLFAELMPHYLIGDDLSSLADPNSYFLRARGGINYHF